jgi:hypothetical protein
MNICDYIKKHELPHQIIDGELYQVGVLYLNNKGITSLNGFFQTNRLYLKGNNITSLDGFNQTESLYLNDNKITSLNGFTQNDYLNLRGNNITSLNGFMQTACVDLSNNNITSLDGFIQNGAIDLKGNKIKSLKGFKQTKKVMLCKWTTMIVGDVLHIGCKQKTLPEWKVFFNEIKSYQTNVNTKEYEDIKYIFNMYYNEYYKPNNLIGFALFIIVIFLSLTLIKTPFNELNYIQIFSFIFGVLIVIPISKLFIKLKLK